MCGAVACRGSSAGEGSGKAPPARERLGGELTWAGVEAQVPLGRRDAPLRGPRSGDAWACGIFAALGRHPEQRPRPWCCAEVRRGRCRRWSALEGLAECTWPSTRRGPGGLAAQRRTLAGAGQAAACGRPARGVVGCGLRQAG